MTSSSEGLMHDWVVLPSVLRALAFRLWQVFRFQGSYDGLRAFRTSWTFAFFLVLVWDCSKRASE